MKKIRHILEFVLVYAILLAIRVSPVSLLKILSKLIGSAIFYISKKRRNIALTNISEAFKDSLKEDSVKRMALKSCQSLALTFLEAVKYQNVVSNSQRLHEIASKNEGILKVFHKAKELHDKYNGCIFVTPHLGNWEILPHVSHSVGIPLIIVARPLDNPYLEKLLLKNRTSTGQIFIPKKNALYKLQQYLKKGFSIGLLPDQSTKKGLNVVFFGKTATATPVPALLSISYKRPIVVVCCCRDETSGEFVALISDPILPSEDPNERQEIQRITQIMTSQMEEFIRLYPNQYLWIHNRWKVYD
ncbi:MAG: lysophospholipid acyltransferase family protein [Thermodesulfovibrionales bacterium]|nr:lysophospholipid acyltransferase family protein [Thermodesulfovibrionales bacterium]